MTNQATSTSHPTPRKRGRPKTPLATAETRQKLLRAGLIALTERGYSSVGVEDILVASGVPKGSFYHYFKSKAAFGAALIEAYDLYLLERLDRTLGEEGVPPLERLQRFMVEAQVGMARHGFRRGCLVGNLGQEMGALPEDFRGQLIAVLDGWQQRVADCLDQAIEEGGLPKTTDAQALARFFWTGWEGAVLRAKLEQCAAPLEQFSQIFMALVTAKREEDNV